MSRFVFATAQYASGDWESAPLLPANLVDSLVRYTDIEAAPAGVTVALDSEALLDHPFVWLTGHQPVRFSDAERKNLERYVRRGGFVVVDDHNHDINGAFHKTAHEEIERCFGPMQRLPNSHELYRAFFVFEHGPPATHHELNGWGDDLVHNYLDAVLIEGRIGLIYSSKDYSSEWDFHPESKRFMSEDVTRFGVNLMVYALTR